MKSFAALEENVEGEGKKKHKNRENRTSEAFTYALAPAQYARHAKQAPAVAPTVVVET